jgi:arsenate reductase-like glutaredoxin family protein
VEIEKFLRGLEINLTVRDIRKNPLDYRQLSKLFKSFDLEHFVNPCSNSGKEKTFDLTAADRKDVLQQLADDNSCLRRPIVVCGRLMTVGYDRRRIVEMLQIDAAEAGSDAQAESAA